MLVNHTNQSQDLYLHKTGYQETHTTLVLYINTNAIPICFLMEDDNMPTTPGGSGAH